jgi:transposase
VGYATDLTDVQRKLVKSVLCAPGKRGRPFEDIREVVGGMLYVAHTGCEWRYLPEWTPIWPKARRAAALRFTLGVVALRSHPRRPMTPTPTQPCSHSRPSSASPAGSVWSWWTEA